MRSIWKGAVSFGLVNIGVKLYSATEERDVSFHQVRRSDGSRIRYRRVAEADGEEVAYADIAKGYTLDSGDTVVLTDDDFADLPLVTARTVDVLHFVPRDQIDPIYFAKSYYLEPEKSAVKPYVLLRDALEDSGMVGLTKIALRNREQLATLRVRDGVIVLETMVWPDEVRAADFAFLDEDVELRPQERQMAESLVTSMAGEFDPEEFHDDYREALQAVIEAKVEGREVIEAPDQDRSGGGQVVDLMAALRASVDAAKKGAGSGSTPAKTPAAPSSAAGRSATKDDKAPAKAAAKKSPAKAAAKKSPAKAAAKKSPAKAAAKKSPAKAAAKKSPAKAAAKKSPAEAAARKTAARKSA